MQNIDISKAADIESLSGKFLKHGAEILVKPITEIYNLSITSITFLNTCKVAWLMPIFKKVKKTTPSNFKNFKKVYSWSNKCIP